jgi:hypothetical protein
VAPSTLPHGACFGRGHPSGPERNEEYARLEVKYGPRNPDANGTGTKTSRRRLTTRPMQALTTTR